MKQINILPPSFQEIKKHLDKIIKKFNPYDLVFLNCQGKWETSPHLIRDKAAHELLFSLWKPKSNTESKEGWVNIFFSLTEPDQWPTSKTLAWMSLAQPKTLPSKMEPTDHYLMSFYGRSSKNIKFFIAWEALLELIEIEVLKLLAAYPVPEWKKDEKTIQNHFQRLCHQKQELFKKRSSLDGSNLEFILDHSFKIYLNSSQPIKNIINILAEEERLNFLIEIYLNQAKNSKQPHLFFHLINERIQPELGLAERVSPALLRPCLNLLLNKDIPIESGLQYTASVILSILQDIRSTEKLLYSLAHFPLNFSKIRENIIYTLGNLKEARAVPYLRRLLRTKKDIISLKLDKTKKFFIREQKEEAIWALGKIGLDAEPALPELTKYTLHPSTNIRAALAWTLGEIGRLQKDIMGGVSAEIIISLLKLLQQKDKVVFEETVTALKKIELPEFLHALYLYNVSAVNILGIPPAQKGLYEVSETIHALLRSQKRVIMAVNGDSGTGKTYFCQAIREGFGDIKKEEILYLMRDRRKDQRILNRLLGLRWLKKYIDPSHYQDYPLDEKKDNPEEFLHQFLTEEKDRKLIILDGCRDKHYFQRIIDILYSQGFLDLVVNFRASHSTRRINLEQREIALESIKNHLSFLEDPALEDTIYYQEGKIYLYDLDNSTPCRLNREEIQELFNSKRIETWEIFIRPGKFDLPCLNLQRYQSSWPFIPKSLINPVAASFPKFKIRSLPAREKKFKLQVNAENKVEPFLIASINLDSLHPVKLSYYAQDQIAGQMENKGLFIYSFIDNHLFYQPSLEVSQFTLLKRVFYFFNKKGKFFAYSFEKNELTAYDLDLSPITTISSLPPSILITGHQDGQVCLWNMDEHQRWIIQPSLFPITLTFIDYFYHLLIGDNQGKLFLLKPENDSKWSLNYWDSACNFFLARKYRPRQILFLTREIQALSSVQKVYSLNWLNLKKNSLFQTHLPENINPLSLWVIPDGRIIFAAAIRNENEHQAESASFLVIPHDKTCLLQRLFKPEENISDVITTGPRIISCGQNKRGGSLKIWGSKEFARIERQKILIKPN